MTHSKIPLSIKGLNKIYAPQKGKNQSSTQALRNVDLEMKSGEILGLLGPNGAGKTSLISILTTLESATAGEVEIFGSSISRSSRQELMYLKNTFGLVPQEVVSHGFFSVLEVLEFLSGYHGIRSNHEHVEFLLKRLALWEHRHKKVNQLSGGMRRRFMIAKALVHKPQLLLLDEPTAGVDIELRATLWSFVRELNKTGVSVLLTTHYLEEAEELCDRVAIIDQGEIKKIGPTKELIRDLTHRHVEILIKNSVPKCESPYLQTQTESKLEFIMPSKMAVGELLQSLKLDMSVIVDLKIREGNLEEAFLKILKAEGK